MVAFATQVKRRRGTTAQNDAFTGAEGEIVVDTERHELRVHDGVTMGGFKIGGGTSLPLLTRLITEHTLNDESFLNSNTFSWQSGDVYDAVYKHLVDGLSTAGAVQTEIIEGITILYKVATDGLRICAPNQETAISELYAKTGAANYYILDTTNSQFKLPRTQKRKLIRAVKNTDGTWYNLYSDGLVEQGGRFSSTVTNSFNTITLPVAMRDTNYVAFSSNLTSYEAGTGSSHAYVMEKVASINNLTTTTIGVFSQNTGRDFIWQISGYAADSVIANEPIEYEYYYVGNFTKEATENTAGLNAELFNNKADLNLMNTAANVDFVIESQDPTADNGYTWYRKYKSGWVEQGGRALVPATNGLSSSSVTVTLPIPIASPEQATLSYNGMGSTGYYSNCEDMATVTTTTVSIGRWNNGNPVAEARYYNWTLSGMSAQ